MWSSCIYFSAEKLQQLFLLTPGVPRSRTGATYSQGSLVLWGTCHTFSLKLSNPTLIWG